MCVFVVLLTVFLARSLSPNRPPVAAVVARFVIEVRAWRFEADDGAFISPLLPWNTFSWSSVTFRIVVIVVDRL